MDSAIGMGGIRLGKLLGIPIRINYSFLLLLAILLIWQGLTGALMLLVTFISVLLHELGHALVARRMNVPIIGIDLHFFGGAAKMARMPSCPREEILISIAGPAVSFAIAILALAVYLPFGLGAAAYLAVINIMLGGFNLLPALPMDGGRIFRALLARRLGRLRATSIAVTVARVIAVGLGLLGLVWGNYFLTGLAVLLWMMAGSELRAAQLWSPATSGPGGPLGGPTDWSAGDPATTRPQSTEVEVLDQDGQIVGGRRPGPGSAAGGVLIVEEQQVGGLRRWVVRDRAGQIVFMAEQPLRW